MNDPVDWRSSAIGVARAAVDCDLQPSAKPPPVGLHIPLLLRRLDGFRAHQAHLRHGVRRADAGLPQQAGGDGARAAQAALAVQEYPSPFPQGDDELGPHLRPALLERLPRRLPIGDRQVAPRHAKAQGLARQRLDAQRSALQARRADSAARLGTLAVARPALEQELAAAFGIRSIPTLLFIPTSGKPQIAQGALPKASLKEAIDKVLLNK